MKLSKIQSQIAKDRSRFRVVNCGRRFGKTTLAIEEMVGYAVYHDDSRIAYIAPTYQQARDIAWEMLKKKVSNIATNINESRLEITVSTVNGKTSVIVLRGWESVETLRGQFFHFLVIDEVASMRNFWTNWQEVLRPTLTDTIGEALFISTPKGYNHFFDLYNYQDDKKVNSNNEWKSFHATSYDNPYLSRDEIDAAKQQMTEDRFAQEYLADFRKTEKLVYKEFNRNVHLYDELPNIQFIEKIGGLDFGFNNPFAALKIYKDFDNCYWVDDERYQSGKTDSEIVEICKSLDCNVWYPDPEAPATIEVMRRSGLNIREVKKSRDSISLGITKVQELFKSGRLKINKRCINLIWELETYSYPEKRNDRNEDENPIKENDHAVDALRYALMMNLPSHITEDEFNLYSQEYK